MGACWYEDKGHGRYITDIDKFEDKQLPPNDVFYSMLNGSNCSDQDCSYAQTVWETFKCGTLGDFRDHYLTFDVLFTADVLHNFCRTCIYTDPAGCYTCPRLSWQALLHLTNVKLSFSLILICICFQGSPFDGVFAQSIVRYAKANNHFLAEEIPYILQMGMNNLYGPAISDFLPQGEFKWEQNVKEWNKVDKILN